MKLAEQEHTALLLLSPEYSTQLQYIKPHHHGAAFLVLSMKCHRLIKHPPLLFITLAPSINLKQDSMKKPKNIFFFLAVFISVTGAIANVRQPWCAQQLQFYRMTTPWGNYYIPAGRLGVDYACTYAPYNTCTYYQVNGSEQFAPCQQGYFTPLYY